MTDTATFWCSDLHKDGNRFITCKFGHLSLINSDNVRKHQCDCSHTNVDMTFLLLCAQHSNQSSRMKEDIYPDANRHTETVKSLHAGITQMTPLSQRLSSGASWGEDTSQYDGNILTGAETCSEAVQLHIMTMIELSEPDPKMLGPNSSQSHYSGWVVYCLKTVEPFLFCGSLYIHTEEVECAKQLLSFFKLKTFETRHDLWVNPFVITQPLKPLNFTVLG